MVFNKSFSQIFVVVAVLVIMVRAKDSEITKAFRRFEVIPDVVDKGPKEMLQVIYGNGMSVYKGIELTPTEVKRKPSVQWYGEPSVYYTLIMTDPDVPSRRHHTMREWQHWVVGNIPGSELSKGEVLSAYIGAAPTKDTDLHRYVFLLYKQCAKLSFDEQHLGNNSTANRKKFSTRKFVKKHGLGDPIAGNFFHSQFDDYVPQLYQQLGGNQTNSTQS